MENNETTTYKEVTEDGEMTKVLLEVNTFDPSSGNSIKMTDNDGDSVQYEYTDNLLSKTMYSMNYQEIEGQAIVEKPLIRQKSRNIHPEKILQKRLTKTE